MYYILWCTGVKYDFIKFTYFHEPKQWNISFIIIMMSIFWCFASSYITLIMFIYSNRLAHGGCRLTTSRVKYLNAKFTREGWRYKEDQLVGIFRIFKYLHQSFNYVIWRTREDPMIFFNVYIFIMIFFFFFFKRKL